MIWGSFSSAQADSSDPVREYVASLYPAFLGREADESGLNSWTDQLVSGSTSLASVLFGFVYSREYQLHPQNNSDYIRALYLSILQREPDQSGMEYWLNFLIMGCTRAKILEGFLNSSEFGSLCSRLGVRQGSFTSSEPVDLHPYLAGFVSTLYRELLQREPDTEGLNHHVSLLSSGSLSAADFIYSMAYSKEFLQNPLGNEDYAAALYRAILSREPSEEEIRYWTEPLENGCTRKYVLQGIVNSRELSVKAESLGIRRGSYVSDSILDRSPQLTAFVWRLYRICLDRTADEGGLEYWTDALLSGSKGAWEVAFSFLRSQEYRARNTSHEVFLTHCYQALFDRDPDTTGWNTWLGRLQSGRSRNSVLGGFLESTEFRRLCSSYQVTYSVQPAMSRRITATAVSETTDQLILVFPTSGTQADFTLYERSGGIWNCTVSAVANIGKNGLGKTVAGDMKTPRGVYRFTKAFGNAPDPGSVMPYTQVNETHYWCGDSSSPYYNQFVSTATHTGFDRSEGEHIIDYGKTYNYCLNISYNENGVPGLGSCIFLHCYSNRNYTAGCVAVPESTMIQILQQVRSTARILIDDGKNLENY